MGGATRSRSLHRDRACWKPMACVGAAVFVDVYQFVGPRCALEIGCSLHEEHRWAGITGDTVGDAPVLWPTGMAMAVGLVGAAVTQDGQMGTRSVTIRKAYRVALQQKSMTGGNVNKTIPWMRSPNGVDAFCAVRMVGLCLVDPLPPERRGLLQKTW